MSEDTFDDILEAALERAYDAGASHNNRILWEGLEALTSTTAARLRGLKVATPSRIETVRRFAAEERPLHVGVEWVRELAAEIDALTPTRPEPVAWARVREMIRVEIVDTYTHADGMTNSALRLIEADAGVVADSIVADLESTHPSAAAGAEPFDARGARRLAEAAADLVRRGVVSSRSPLGDALLDFAPDLCTMDAPVGAESHQSVPSDYTAPVGAGVTENRIEAAARAIYLHKYGAMGGRWECVETKDVWHDLARAALSTTDASEVRG